MSTFDTLPDDILSTILLYSDFASGFTLSQRTNRRLKNRLESGNFRHVWKAVFERHNFSSVQEDSINDFLTHCQTRRSLLHTLVRAHGKNRFYKLPDHHYSFCPISQPQIEPKDDEAEVDSQSGNFFEDSFTFTSTATSPEMVLLNPYDGTLSVIDDCRNAKAAKRQRLMHSNDPFSYYPGTEVPPTQLEFSYAGTESKPIIDPTTNTCTGTLLWTDRIVRRAADKEALCTELTTWTRAAGESQYGDRRSCYTPGTFQQVDIDTKNLRAFVSFPAETDTLSPVRTSRIAKENQLIVYPLLPYDRLTSEEDGPMPDLTISCEHPISAFSVDATGETLIVSTTKGTIEIWKVESSSVQRIQTINMRKALKDSIQRRLTDLKIIMSKRSIHENATDRSVNDPCILRRALEKLAPAPIESFYLPKHLAMEKCGFVTSQKDTSSLLLWRKSETSGEYEIASLINLPLSSKREPKVKFDGCRLLVSGQDEDGFTLLVYQVAIGDMPLENMLKKDLPPGGVYNLTTPPSVRLANQLRHRAFGGIEDPEEAVHMSFNERFIAVNTRNGNKLAGSEESNGLLIIDLED
eukprot:scaffold23471_cov141-Cylindrotheca_fusiformis.AAC.9